MCLITDQSRGEKQKQTKNVPDHQNKGDWIRWIRSMAVTERHLELMPLILVGHVWQILAQYIVLLQNHEATVHMHPYSDP